MKSAKNVDSIIIIGGDIMDKKQLKIGVGREIITPKIGTLLVGYRPDVESKSINDDLTVTTLMLEYGEVQAMIITVTVCEIADVLITELRKKISSETGITGNHIIIGATHTHSGPDTMGIPGWGGINWEYVNEILIPQTVKAAKTAFESSQPAKMGIGTTQSDIGVNRREIDRYGNIHLGRNPWGLYDPTLTVLSFKTLDDKPLFNLIHYSCHGTAAGMNHEISRDWSGPMIDRLEQQSGAMTAFINGAEGDVGPRLSNGTTTGDITHVRELGAKAAFAAINAYRGIKDYRTDIDLKVMVKDISLPYKELPPIEEVESELAKYENPESLINVSYLIYNRLKNLAELIKSGGDYKTHLTFTQTLIAMGPVVFVPFPFEMFVEITLRLRHYSPYQYTLCLSNANGTISYLPSQDQLCRGGYEIRAFIAADVYTLTDNVDDNIINANLDMLEELKCTE